MRYDAVLLDAGGVLVLPDAEPVLAALDAAGLRVDADQRSVDRAHYLGMRALDGGPPDDAEWDRYVTGLVAGLGLDAEASATAAEALRPVWQRPASELWRSVPRGTLDGLHALEATDAKLAVVSNSDGTVEESLRALGLCQVGAGSGVGMCIVVDSFVVETAKPKPEIFDHALRATGARPERTLHVGDGVRYDVDGARLAGIAAAHFDPFGVCPLRDHRHIASLSALADQLPSG